MTSVLPVPAWYSAPPLPPFATPHCDTRLDQALRHSMLALDQTQRESPLWLTGPVGQRNGGAIGCSSGQSTRPVEVGNLWTAEA